MKAAWKEVRVAPRVGAWIETKFVTGNLPEAAESHPAWVRGLKLYEIKRGRKQIVVAPRVGAWIETLPDLQPFRLRRVAPRVGAWIETGILPYFSALVLASHPAWVRGLKHD